MKLSDYLRRIGYDGDIAATSDALTALHEAHVCSVPFENLDVQLGRPLSIDAEDAFEKIVVNRRGGWCYEQNGLFAWVLSEIGFEVTRIAASVMREERGEMSSSNHLCLLVRTADTATPYLVDVGFGGSMIRPIALAESQYNQPPFRIGLEKLPDGHWRFWENTGDGRFSYDFREQAADESALARRSEFLQNDPSSGFVLNLVAQKRSRDRHQVLRGRTLNRIGADGSESTLIASAEELIAILSNEFGLVVPELAALWPRITAWHEELFAASLSCDEAGQTVS